MARGERLAGDPCEIHDIGSHDAIRKVRARRMAICRTRPSRPLPHEVLLPGTGGGRGRQADRTGSEERPSAGVQPGGSPLSASALEFRKPVRNPRTHS